MDEKYTYIFRAGRPNASERGHLKEEQGNVDAAAANNNSNEVKSFSATAALFLSLLEKTFVYMCVRERGFLRATFGSLCISHQEALCFHVTNL
jgi:hypothetical protein